MDVLFGSYHHPPDEPASVGITEPMPKSYFGQLLHPFFRQKRRDKVGSARPLSVESSEHTELATAEFRQ
jgi:hypothetical protein